MELCVMIRRRDSSGNEDRSTQSREKYRSQQHAQGCRPIDLAQCNFYTRFQIRVLAERTVMTSYWVETRSTSQTHRFAQPPNSLNF